MPVRWQCWQISYQNTYQKPNLKGAEYLQLKSVGFAEAQHFEGFIQTTMPYALIWKWAEKSQHQHYGTVLAQLALLLKLWKWRLKKPCTFYTYDKPLCGIVLRSVKKAVLLTWQKSRITRYCYINSFQNIFMLSFIKTLN